MTIKVAFLGPEGTYTHQAVIQQFGNDREHVQIYPAKSIGDCFRAINAEDVDYAVVPFENSTNGQVVYTYDLIRDWFIPSLQSKHTQPNISSSTVLSPSATSVPRFKIVAEQFVAIHHNFLTNAENLEDIKTIYSHPQVWTQVGKFLSSKEIPAHAAKIDSPSTSKAAELVYEDKTNTTACISSQMSADLYGLPVRFPNVEDNVNNTTRFLVLGYKEPPTPPKDEEDDKSGSMVTSIIFTLNHDDPGALCDVLIEFKKNGVSLTSINSRPSHLKQWQYVFFAEIVGDLSSDHNIEESIREASKTCQELVILGTFKRSWRYWSSASSKE
ncbi:Prephenate dehydratase [Scheffersomyces xylosifermentans]|uniref:Prephenate dehydratase n=1 Tax=Scheffersomyces xylosifermentans TaxID=1304137 RepID=UPI00315C62C2